MRESREIAHARAIRNGQKADLSSLAQFERDFRGADWFRQHSKCEPADEISLRESKPVVVSAVDKWIPGLTSSE